MSCHCVRQGLSASAYKIENPLQISPRHALNGLRSITLKKKRTTARLPAEERREKILKKALSLLARHGFANTSFQMIADACDVTQSAILYHFNTKEKLVEAVLHVILKHNHDLVEAAFDMKDGGLERLKKYFDTTLRWACDFRDEARIILLLYYFASMDRGFAALYSKIVSGARSRIQGYLCAAVREKKIRDDIDTVRISVVLHDALLGSIVNALAEQNIENQSAEIALRWNLLVDSLLVD